MNAHKHGPFFKYRTENSPVFERNLIIKTSESIGTLNSEYTDRSFAIKDNSFFAYNSASKDKQCTNVNKSEKKNTICLDHLKQLCESDEEKETSQFVYAEQVQSTQKEKKQKIGSALTPSFNKFAKDGDTCSSQVSNGESIISIKMPRKENLLKYHPILFQEEKEQKRELYEHVSAKDQSQLPQLPSNQSQSKAEKQRISLDLIYSSTAYFEENYAKLQQAFQNIQKANSILVNQINQKEDYRHKLEATQSQLIQLISTKRNALKVIINQKNELEGILKQVLLCRQIQRRKEIEMEKKKGQTAKRTILDKINLKIQK